MKSTAMKFIILAASILLIVITGCDGIEKKDPNAIPSITIDDLYQRKAAGDNLQLLDVRTLPEFNGQLGHFAGGILIPHTEVANRLNELKDWKEKEIIVYCRTGRRSAIATKIMVANGFKAVNLLGGITAWQQKYGNVR